LHFIFAANIKILSLYNNNTFSATEKKLNHTQIMTRIVVKALTKFGQLRCRLQRGNMVTNKKRRYKKNGSFVNVPMLGFNWS